MVDHGVEGRVVIVTGAGQGIGRGIARHLARHGASVVVSEWKAQRVDRVVAELVDLGAPALGVASATTARSTRRWPAPSSASGGSTP